VPLRGILDRLDDGPDGLRVVDYKTGATPGEGYESGVLFQLKFYALAVLLTHGRVPDELRLLYLADGTAPDLPARRRGAHPLRAPARGGVDRHPARRPHRGLPAPHRPGLPHLRPQGPLPRVGRYSPAVSRLAGRRGMIDG
jgi:hypothetical protein